MSSNRSKNIPEQFEGRKIYSISRLKAFHECKHNYHLTYNQRLKGLDNIYASLGTNVHESLEEMQFGKMTKEEALARFETCLLSLELQGIKFDKDSIKHNFCESIKNYIDNYEPIKCDHFKSELEFFVECGGAVLKGYIDAIAISNDGEVIVYDYKTSTKFAKADLDKHGLQLVLYAYALEKEFNVKISKVAWIMLKYATVTWDGATFIKDENGNKVPKKRQGFYLRSDLVKSLRTELKKDLRKEGFEELEIEVLLDKAQTTNDMTLFSKTIQDKYKITNGVVEYPYNEETKAMLEQYVKDTVKEIESLDATNSSLWEGKDLSANIPYFCNVLCGHRKHCKYYKEALDRLEDKKNGLDNLPDFMKSQSDNENSELDELKKLLGI